MDNKIIEKIQKLLALATSPNENEAKAAATKANALLVKHNLKLQDVEGVNLEYEKDILDESTKLPVEAKFVNNILIDHFFVKIVHSRNRYKGMTTMYILGEETNVAVARYIYSFLIRKFYELWMQYKKENNLPASHKQSYYVGLMRGLNQQLKEKRKNVEQEEGLILVNDPNLNKFMNGAFDKLSKNSQSFRSRNSQAMRDGENTGRSLHISQGIDSKTDQSGKYLQ